MESAFALSWETIFLCQTRPNTLGDSLMFSVKSNGMGHRIDMSAGDDIDQIFSYRHVSLVPSAIQNHFLFNNFFDIQLSLFKKENDLAYEGEFHGKIRGKHRDIFELDCVKEVNNFY